jgi:hypothetical protein
MKECAAHALRVGHGNLAGRSVSPLPLAGEG